MMLFMISAVAMAGNVSKLNMLIPLKSAAEMRRWFLIVIIQMACSCRLLFEYENNQISVNLHAAAPLCPSRFLIKCAKLVGCRCVGIEVDEERAAEAQANIEAAGQFSIKEITMKLAFLTSLERPYFS